MFVFTATNCHIAVLGAEVDNVSPPELVKQFEEVLSTKPEVKKNSFVLFIIILFCSIVLQIAKSYILLFYGFSFTILKSHAD